MELASTDIAAMGAGELVRVSASIPRAAPRTFALLTAFLVFPLSLAVLAHSLFTHPILLRIQGATHSSDVPPQWLLKLVAYQFVYLIVLFTFSLLSTAAVVFTVASLYANKPASISSSLTALPTILPRLLRTFLWVSLLILAYHVVFVLSVLLLVIVFIPNALDSDYDYDSAAPLSLSFKLFIVVDGAVFFWIHVYISALWHLASVVSVLEPICGLAALAKSRQLLQGRTGGVARSLVADYLAICGVISLLFGAAVVQGPDEEGSFGLAWPWRLLAGAVLVCLLAGISLLGLLVQSVVYYTCKAYHNQPIDRSALYEHLGEYLGEYVPLKSNIEMENLNL